MHGATLIRRHLKGCARTSTTYRRCKCPIHVYGTLGGEKIRKALDLTSWEAASEKIRECAFFRFCHQADWIKTNPALAVKPPKVKHAPTLPFSPDEMKRIIDACDEYRGNKARIKAFVLTMRYTGLRIGDTITLSKSQVLDGKIFVRTAKTGQPIFVPVPADLLANLAKVNDGSDRYFWTGKNVRSAVSNWSRYLARIFELADVQNAHSHRFRDTCAVELLLADASVEDVATILGNSPRVVEKHYAPWVKARQDRLEKLVRASWAQQQSAETRTFAHCAISIHALSGGNVAWPGAPFILPSCLFALPIPPLGFRGALAAAA